MIIIEKTDLVIDNFAGGGGASSGMESALGRHIDIAINHDPKAIAIHTLNHPLTKHLCESVYTICPISLCKGRVVGVIWFSPDCKHFSKAKGGAPVDQKIRGLAWVMLKWLAMAEVKIAFLENVNEFTSWGPLDAEGRPCKERQGETYVAFIACLTEGLRPDHPALQEICEAVPEVDKRVWIKGLGYTVETKSLAAHEYGAPTIRNRFFLVARKFPGPIRWPKITNGPEMAPYKTAADIIDWRIPCKSIFNRKKPLAENTLRRIHKGLCKYVMDPEQVFIAPDGETVSFITECANGSSQRNIAVDEPLRTICAQPKGGSFALVSAFIAKHYTGVVGSHMEQPIGTITTVDHHSLVAAYMVKLRNNNHAVPVDGPLHTITAGGGHFGLVAAFMVQYYGTDNVSSCREPLRTITTRDRIALVKVQGDIYAIKDIGLRMLQPKELYLAQGFKESYKFSRYPGGKKTTKADQIKWCGNSVSPIVAEALVKANVQVEPTITYLEASNYV